MYQNNFLLLGHNKIASETMSAAEFIYKKQLSNFYVLDIQKNEKPQCLNFTNLFHILICDLLRKEIKKFFVWNKHFYGNQPVRSWY